MSAGPRRGDDGFTIVESVVALSLMMIVMVGMIATVNTGMKGARIGRQRAAATSVAEQALESTKAVAYDLLGHDYAGDPTIGSDAALVPVSGSTTFESETLVGAAGGIAVLDPHQASVAQDGTTFDRRVYVTWPGGAVEGGPLKRVTVIVSWDQGMGGPTGQIAQVRLSTIVDETGLAAPLAGTATVDAALPTLTVTGTANGHAVDARLVLPSITSGLDHGAVPAGSAVATSTAAEASMTGVTLTGCATATGFTNCGPDRLAAVADASADTVASDQSVLGPTVSPGGTGAADTISYLVNGGGSEVATSVMAAGAGQGDADGLPYGSATASSPALADLQLVRSGLTGHLLKTTSAGTASGAVDVDPVGAGNWVTTTGSLSGPALSLASFDNSISGADGYAGAVQIGSYSLGATSTVGYGAPPASLTASTVTVNVYNGGGYSCYKVAPASGAVTDCGGTPATIPSSFVGFGMSGGYFAFVTTTVTVTPAATAGTLTAGNRLASSASAVGWLQVDTHLDVFKGASVASLDLHYDAGRLAVSATGVPRS